MQTTAVTRVDTRVTASAFAQVVPKRPILLQSKAAGRIAALPVDAGDTVTQGTLLVTLDQPEIVQAEERARLAFEVLERKCARAQALFDRQLIADEQFEAISLEKKNAHVAWQHASLLKEELTLRAPCDGQILSTIEATQLVTPGVVLIQLLPKMGHTLNFEIDPLWLQCMPSLLQFKDQQLRVLRYRYAPVRNPITQRIAVQATLQTPLQLGESGVVQFAQEQAIERVIIPERALVFHGSQVGVFSVDTTQKPAQVHFHAVRLGRTFPQGQEILEGLEVGQQIVIDGVHKVQDKTYAWAQAV